MDGFLPLILPPTHPTHLIPLHLLHLLHLLNPPHLLIIHPHILLNPLPHLLLNPLPDLLLQIILNLPQAIPFPNNLPNLFPLHLLNPHLITNLHLPHLIPLPLIPLLLNQFLPSYPHHLHQYLNLSPSLLGLLSYPTISLLAVFFSTS